MRQLVSASRFGGMVQVPRPALIDVVIALALAVAAAIELAGMASRAELPAAVVVGSLTTLPLAWRRHDPFLVTLLVSAGVALSPLIGLDWTKGLVVLVSWLVALYSLANGTSVKRISIGTAAAICAPISLLWTQADIAVSDITTALAFGAG